MKNWIKSLTALNVLLMLMIVPVAASVAFTPSSPQTIAKGDTFTISGTNSTNGTVAIWVIGRNYFRVSTAVPDKTGNFTMIVMPEDTGQFSSGQYAFVIQDPGTNGKTEIKYRIAQNGNITILNVGTPITDIGPKQDIRANAAPVVEKLQAVATLTGVDDIFTPYYFFVEEPSIHFDQKAETNPDGQLPNQTSGERIFFSGTTNMGIENPLHADIRNLATNTLILTKTIPVIAGSEKNRWSFKLDEPGLPPGEYYITVGWMKSNTTGTGSAMFTVVEKPGFPPSNDSGAIPLSVVIGGGILLVFGFVVFAYWKK